MSTTIKEEYQYRNVYFLHEKNRFIRNAKYFVLFKCTCQWKSKWEYFLLK